MINYYYIIITLMVTLRHRTNSKCYEVSVTRSYQKIIGLFQRVGNDDIHSDLPRFLELPRKLVQLT